MRDSQRRKVYTAESELLASCGIAFKDIDEVQRYVDRVLRSKWWTKNAYSPYQHIEMVQRRGYGGVAWGTYRIEVGRHSLKQTLVLHELAHCGSPTYSLHNWQFCDFYLRLVRRFLGREPWLQLRAAFKANRVKVHPPRKGAK